MNPSYPDSLEETEDRVDAMLRKGREYLGDHLACCEERISESPAKAVLIAFGAGYIARSLPLGSMLSVPLKLAARVAPPLLFALGVAKACEAIRCANQAKLEREEEEPLLDLFPEHSAAD